jgi:S-(hydroxymethyl)glutathione dehydrogenase/alcohol dehydrogenase
MDFGIDGKLHMGRRVVGSHGGNTVPDVDIPRVARLYQMGKFKIDEQISHELPLEQVNEAIQLVRGGSADRCVLKMG